MLNIYGLFFLSLASAAFPAIANKIPVGNTYNDHLTARRAKQFNKQGKETSVPLVRLDNRLPEGCQPGSIKPKERCGGLVPLSGGTFLTDLEGGPYGPGFPPKPVGFQIRPNVSSRQEATPATIGRFLIDDTPPLLPPPLSRKEWKATIEPLRSQLFKGTERQRQSQKVNTIPEPLGPLFYEDMVTPQSLRLRTSENMNGVTQEEDRETQGSVSDDRNSPFPDSFKDLDLPDPELLKLLRLQQLKREHEENNSKQQDSEEVENSIESEGDDKKNKIYSRQKLIKYDEARSSGEEEEEENKTSNNFSEGGTENINQPEENGGLIRDNSEEDSKRSVEGEGVDSRNSEEEQMPLVGYSNVGEIPFYIKDYSAEQERQNYNVPYPLRRPVKLVSTNEDYISEHSGEENEETPLYSSEVEPGSKHPEESEEDDSQHSDEETQSNEGSVTSEEESTHDSNENNPTGVSEGYGKESQKTQSEEISSNEESEESQGPTSTPEDPRSSSEKSSSEDYVSQEHQEGSPKHSAEYEYEDGSPEYYDVPDYSNLEVKGEPSKEGEKNSDSEDDYNNSESNLIDYEDNKLEQSEEEENSSKTTQEDDSSSPSEEDSSSDQGPDSFEKNTDVNGPQFENDVTEKPITTTVNSTPQTTAAKCTSSDDSDSTLPPIDLKRLKKPLGTAKPKLPGLEDTVSFTKRPINLEDGLVTRGTPTTTVRPALISALGIMKPDGSIISKEVSPTVHVQNSNSTKTSRAQKRAPLGWRNVLAAREAIALTYLKPPPIGQAQTWFFKQSRVPRLVDNTGRAI